MDIFDKCDCGGHGIIYLNYSWYCKDCYSWSIEEENFDIDIEYRKLEIERERKIDNIIMENYIKKRRIENNDKK